MTKPRGKSVKLKTELLSLASISIILLAFLRPCLPSAKGRLYISKPKKPPSRFSFPYLKDKHF